MRSGFKCCKRLGPFGTLTIEVDGPASLTHVCGKFVYERHSSNRQSVAGAFQLRQDYHASGGHRQHDDFDLWRVWGFAIDRPVRISATSSTILVLHLGSPRRTCLGSSPIVQIRGPCCSVLLAVMEYMTSRSPPKICRAVRQRSVGRPERSQDPWVRIAGLPACTRSAQRQW
jgi:hypothetical protein